MRHHSGSQATRSVTQVAEHDGHGKQDEGRKRTLIEEVGRREDQRSDGNRSCRSHPAREGTLDESTKEQLLNDRGPDNDEERRDDPPCRSFGSESVDLPPRSIGSVESGAGEDDEHQDERRWQASHKSPGESPPQVRPLGP